VAPLTEMSASLSGQIFDMHPGMTKISGMPSPSCLMQPLQFELVQERLLLTSPGAAMCMMRCYGRHATGTGASYGAWTTRLVRLGGIGGNL